MKRPISFRFEIDQEDDGRWLASVPQYPGVMCYGESVQAAVSAAMDLALKVILDKLEHGEDEGDEEALAAHHGLTGE